MSIKTDDIKQAREEAGLTQSQAARVLHIPRQTWYHYERGNFSMSVDRYLLFKILVDKSTDNKWQEIFKKLLKKD